MTGELLRGGPCSASPGPSPVGWRSAWRLACWWFGVRRSLNDPPVEVTVSLLIPFAAYLPAEAVGALGVLAVVAAGLYLGLDMAEASPPTRGCRGPFWRMNESR